MPRWVLALLPVCAFGQNFADVRPSPRQFAWQQLETGVLIHLGANTFLDRESGDGTASPEVLAIRRSACSSRPPPMRRALYTKPASRPQEYRS